MKTNNFSLSITDQGQLPTIMDKSSKLFQYSVVKDANSKKKFPEQQQNKVSINIIQENKDFSPIKQRSCNTKHVFSVFKSPQRKSYRPLDNRGFNHRMKKNQPFSSLKACLDPTNDTTCGREAKQTSFDQPTGLLLPSNHKQQYLPEEKGSPALLNFKHPVMIDLENCMLSSSQNKLDNLSRQLTRATQKVVASQVKLAKKEEDSAIIRSILTRDLVVLAVESLYIDRIRPLLIDVFQRIKRNLKALLIPEKVDNDISELLSLESVRLLCTKKQYQECLAITKLNMSRQAMFSTDLVPNEAMQANVSRAIEKVFDIFVLFIFIQSECSDIFTLKMPKTPAPAKLLTALEVASSFNICAYNNFPTIPAFSQFIHQTEVLMRRPPEHSLPWVDPHDPNNPYNEVIWRSFGAFLTSCLTASSMASSTSSLMPYQFKGGRYGLALKLQKTEFPALRSLSLGELCHLVQLAIAGRLLAYENSVLQPVASCIDISGTLLRLNESYSIRSNVSNYKNGSDSETLFGHCGANCDSILSNTLSGDLTTCSDCHESSKENSLVNSTTTPGWNQRPYYDSIHEFADDLNVLLNSRPDGIVTAQLKKALLSKFGKDIIPQKFGYKKLTECLIQNPVISKVCQVICSSPPNDCLLLISRKSTGQNTNFKVHNNFESVPSPGTVSTVASSFEDSPDNHLKSYIKKKAEVDIPAVTLAPVPALMSVTFNAWAAANFNIKNNNDERKSQNNVVIDFGNKGNYFHQLNKNCYKNNISDEEEDDGDILDHVRRVIEAEAKQIDYNSVNTVQETQLPSVYEPYWDCFLCKAEKSGIVVK